MTTVSNKNSPVAASPDPDLGLAYLLDYERGSNGQLFDGVQASGVLVSPDELLTAAHVVYGTNGLRDSGQVYTGYESGSSTGQAAIASVHTIAQADYTTSAGTASDFALIHLATAIAGGTVFDLGDSGSPGPYEVSGYPVGTAGALDTKAETLTVDQPNSNFVGTPENEGSGNAHGSSGGAVWQYVDGAPTVFGVISSESSDGTIGYFKRLTASDVAQIRSWISEDDSAPAAVPPAIAGTTGGQQTTAEAPLSPFSSVTVTDANADATEVLTIALAGAGGVLSGQGLQTSADGTYQLQGTAAGVTAMLRALRFTPTAGAPGVPATTRFSLSDASSAGTSTADSATTVTDTAAPARPVIGGTTGGQQTAAEAPLSPFSSVTVSDANANATEVLTIALAGAGGVLSGQGLQTSADGTYQLQGTAAGVTAMLRALRFTPPAGAPGVPATTRFSLNDASSAGTSTADGATTVTDTAAPAPSQAAPAPSQAAPAPSQAAPVPSQPTPMASAEVTPADPSPVAAVVPLTAVRVVTPATAFQDMVAQKGGLHQSALLATAETEALTAVARAVRRNATTLTDALEAAIARTSDAPHAALDRAFLLGVEYGGIGGLHEALRADLGGSYPCVLLNRATCAVALTGDAMGLALKERGLYS